MDLGKGLFDEWAKIRVEINQFFIMLTVGFSLDLSKAVTKTKQAMGEIFLRVVKFL